MSGWELGQPQAWLALIRVRGMSADPDQRAKCGESDEEKRDFDVVDDGVAKACIVQRGKEAGIDDVADKVAECAARKDGEACGRGLC